ncbi:alpha/beta hydrolase [Leptolyngbya cf. ectocarpi LEGE 11479]|uniref:Alpha/beta hydrolase n=1 Tax=Leptolyngbya cf. ectocarpi LEGE 11479 TaxID=1828722 RepID=A0A928ZU59_LEPEC|nr:alpha/beta hydrolase [Leptolyngbya ectocarpi]MBE9067516.1 alpha/beta hydrolase [Leptolyngbya cf. ectocarpi LEGE 11479]
MEPLFWPKTSLPIRNLRRKLKHGQVFWREIGRGQTVVLLHGSWHDGDQWSDVLPLLGHQYHCLAPDLIGFGESQRIKDKSIQSIAMQVNTLAELLDSLRLESVVLVGHSLGAWVATRFALQYPERVKGLCVLEPEGLGYEPKRWRRSRWLASPLGGLWLSITKPFVRQAAPGQTPPWLQNYHLRQRLRRYPAACRLLFQRRRKDIEAEIVGPQLATLSIPMVVLQGDGAGNTSQQLTQAFTMAAAASVRVKVVPGNDELPSYEAKAVADFLDDWLADWLTD